MGDFDPWSMDNACLSAYKTDMPGYGSVKLDACLRSNHTVLWTVTQPCILIWIWIWIWPAESYRNAGNQATMDMDVYMDMSCSELDATCTPRNPGSYIHVASVCTREHTSHAPYAIRHMHVTRSNTCTRRAHTHVPVAINHMY